MRTQIPDFRLATVLVLGDVMLDRYWQGATQRISPEAPVPIVHVKQMRDCPGGAGNVALNLATLGVKADLYGICGQDEVAEQLIERLNNQCLQHHLQRVATLPTIAKLRVISVHQQLLRMDFEEAFAAVDKTALYADCCQRLAQAQVLVLSDYGKGTLSDPQQLIQAAQLAQVPVVVDPKRTDFHAYRGATIITPNFKEFQAVVGECPDEASIHEKGFALMEAESLTALLITRGAQGMTLLQREHPPLHLPAKAREVYDVTGAGDTVVALMAACLAAGESLATAAKLANVAAGLVVGKLGAAAVTVAELERGWREEVASHLPENRRGALTQEQLAAILQQVTAYGETVVFVMGDFDKLTVEALTHLQRARERGDRLVVVVQETPNKPLLNGLHERIVVVSGLKVVDWVVTTAEPSLSAWLQRLLPDVVLQEPFISYQNGKFYLEP